MESMGGRENGYKGKRAMGRVGGGRGGGGSYRRRKRGVRKGIGWGSISGRRRGYERKSGGSRRGRESKGCGGLVGAEERMKVMGRRGEGRVEGGGGRGRGREYDCPPCISIKVVLSATPLLSVWR